MKTFTHLSCAAAMLALASCDAKQPAAVIAPAPAPASATAAKTLAMCANPVAKEFTASTATRTDILGFPAIRMNAKQATVLATVRTSADVFLWRDADVASETMAFTAEEDLTAPVARSVNDIMAAWAGKAAVSATANAPDRRQAAVRPEGPMGHGYLTLYERADCLVARGQAWPHSPSHPAYLNRTLCVIYYDGQGAAPYATKYSNMAS